MSHRARHGTHGRRPWWLVAVVLTVFGLACLVVWQQPAPTRPTGAGPDTSSGRVGGQSPRSASPREAADPGPKPAATAADVRPVRLEIGAVGVSTSLVGLGLQSDRTVEVPDDPDRAGWYRLGPPPGAVGSSVILGHVDSMAGPAVFARLGELRAGARIDVERADGSVARFAVTDTALYANAAFPARRVYGPHGGKRLNLVTCGGAYDRERGGYQANVVVYSTWMQTTTPGGHAFSRRS